MKSCQIVTSGYYQPDSEGYSDPSTVFSSRWWGLGCNNLSASCLQDDCAE